MNKLLPILLWGGGTFILYRVAKTWRVNTNHDEGIKGALLGGGLLVAGYLAKKFIK